MTEATVDSIELEAGAVTFFSAGDEAAFFGWLKSQPFVLHLEGRGPTIFIRVNTVAIDEYGLREILALFHRYKVDLSQLIVFDREEFAQWFRRKNAYWYSGVFGSQ